MDLRRELEHAERIAREAGAIERRYFGTAIEVEYKGDDDPVTRADRDANDLIVDRLQRAFPSDGILSEEVPDTGAWRNHDRVWMVDPLDGTRDFIRGRDGFSVMIGLCIDGRPRLGVVYQPATGVLYRAAEGLGGEIVLHDGSIAPLRVSAVSDSASIRMVTSASRRAEMIDRVRRVLGVQDERSVGSVGLKVGLIARGDRDLYVNSARRSSLWDSCAPEAIIVAAGGRITDLSGGALEFAGDSLKNERGLVCSNGHVHEAVLEQIAALFAGAGAAT